MTARSPRMRYLAAGTGLAEIALAASLAFWLSSRQPLGFIGFTALLAAPGILLIFWAIAPHALRAAAGVVLAGASVLGLDVVDSSRPVIVALGYAWFVLCLVAALGLLLYGRHTHVSRPSAKAGGPA